MDTQPEHQQRSATNRARAIALWLRDTGLGVLGFAVVLIVAALGWTVSFIGLHTFAMQHMNLTWNQAWFVPGTFDGAAAGLSIVVMRAGIHGRPATLWRTLILSFTVLSSWINWVHISDPSGRFVSAVMPPSAVILFEGIMSEVRAAADERDGKRAPLRVHPLRWVFDRSGTLDLYRRYILGMALPDAIRAATEAPQEAPPERPEDTPQSATADALERHSEPPQSATPTATERPAGAPQDATESATPSVSKTPRERPAKRPKASPRSAAQGAIRALYDDLGRRPLEGEMIAALQRIKSPHTSRQFANKLRAEIEREHPELAAMGSSNVHPLTGTDA